LPRGIAARYDSRTMTTEYLINAAKTDFREGYNNGDVERALSVFSRGVACWPEGQPSYWDDEAHDALRARLEATFAQYHAELFIITVVIRVLSPVAALARGWNKFTLMPKAGGAAVHVRERFFELWGLQPDGSWKIDFYITNREHPAELIENFRQHPAALPALPS